jgi:hypothetical protein
MRLALVGIILGTAGSRWPLLANLPELIPPFVLKQPLFAFDSAAVSRK